MTAVMRRDGQDLVSRHLIRDDPGSGLRPFQRRREPPPVGQGAIAGGAGKFAGVAGLVYGARCRRHRPAQRRYRRGQHVGGFGFIANRIDDKSNNLFTRLVPGKIVFSQAFGSDIAADSVRAISLAGAIEQR